MYRPCEFSISSLASKRSASLQSSAACSDYWNWNTSTTYSSPSTKDMIARMSNERVKTCVYHIVADILGSHANFRAWTTINCPGSVDDAVETAPVCAPSAQFCERVWLVRARNGRDAGYWEYLAVPCRPSVRCASLNSSAFFHILGREYFRIVARSKRGVETAATTNSTHSLRGRVSVGVGCAPVSSKVPDICKKSLARLPCLFDLPYMRCNCQPSLLRGCLDRVDSGGARDFAGN